MAGEDRQKKQRAKRKQERSRGGLKLLNSLILLGILLLLLAAIVMLLVWNRGKATGYNPDEIGTDFDTEELDQVFYKTDEELSGHPEDGELHILFLGNEVLTDGEEADTVPAQITQMLKDRTEDTVFSYVAAVPDARIAAKNPSYDALFPLDLASFFYLSSYIATNDPAPLELYASDSGDAKAQAAAATLQDINYDKLDMIVIMYDAVDYIEGSPVFNEGNAFDPVTYCGALKSGIRAIEEAYPHIRIVFMFPTFCYVYGPDGQLGNSDIIDLGNGDLTTYLIKAIDICQEEGVSIIDHYSGTVDDTNSRELLTDNVHLNARGRRLVAEHFIRVIFP